MGSKKKVLVIGLDCAAPELVFDMWLDKLPNFKRLAEEGVWGPLKSTIPPITVPAWQCMVTSKNPGQLGIFGFRNRSEYSYDNFWIANSEAIKEPAVWDVVSREGHKVGLVGVPQTYPPKPVTAS